VNDTVKGLVINLNAFGATVRLESGELASASAGDVGSHRAEYERALSSRKPLTFLPQRAGRRLGVFLAPQIRDDQLEEQIAGYLKMTQEWESPEEPPAHERHFLRKKKRAALFESRHATDR
jgi:hypothetical protein